MTCMNKRSLIALLVSLALVLSFLTIGVLATDAEAGGDENDTTTVEEQSTTTVENESTSAEEEEDSTTKGEASTTTKSEAATTVDEHAGHDHGEGEGEKDYTSLIVTLSIVAVIIIIAAIVAIKNRVKLAAFLRSVKSEMKKIVWSPKDQTRKNFWVVMIICIAVIILVAILDVAFGTGINKLAEWIKSFRTAA